MTKGGGIVSSRIVYTILSEEIIQMTNRSWLKGGDP